MLINKISNLMTIFPLMMIITKNQHIFTLQWAPLAMFVFVFMSSCLVVFKDSRFRWEKLTGATNGKIHYSELLFECWTVVWNFWNLNMHWRTYWIIHTVLSFWFVADLFCSTLFKQTKNKRLSCNWPGLMLVFRFVS